MRCSFVGLAIVAVAHGLKVDVCQGGACMRAGGASVLEAAEVLAPSGTTVMPAECMAGCCQQVVVRIDGAMEKLIVRREAEAVERALQLVQASGAEINPTLIAALQAKVEAADALLEGSLEDAVSGFTQALMHVDVESHEPAHDEVPTEELVWEETTWACEGGSFGSELIFDESSTAFEFGRVDESATLLTDCSISEADEGNGCTLSGYFEASEGTGELELTMSADGRRFDGVMTWDEDGSTEAWRGVRASESTYSEEPPRTVRWLFESLVGRARAQLQLGDAVAALDDARDACRLCCRARSGWEVRVEAAEACGEAHEAEAARQHLVILA